MFCLKGEWGCGVGCSAATLYIYIKKKEILKKIPTLKHNLKLKHNPFNIFNHEMFFKQKTSC